MRDKPPKDPVTKTTGFEFNFDDWARLADRDPEAFEAQRRQLVKSLIDAAPEEIRHRLQGLQWRLDQVRQKAGSAMAACMEMNRMMWDNVVGDDGLLEAMRLLGNNEPPQAPKQSADIIRMRRTRRP